MTRSLPWPSFVATLLGAVALSAATAAPPPVESFFREPVFSRAQLAPDGRHVAMLVAAKGARQQLTVLDLASMKLSAVGGDPDRDVDSFRWVHDSRLVYDFREELKGLEKVDELPGLFAVDVKGERTRMLVKTIRNPDRRVVRPGDDTETALAPGYVLLHAPGVGMGEDVYLAKPGEDSRSKVDYIDIFRLNTVTGRATELDLPLHAQLWVFGADQQPLAVLTSADGRNEWQIRQADGRWAKGDAFDAYVGGGMHPAYQSADGKLYGVLADAGRGAVYELDRATGRPMGQALVLAPGFDIQPQFLANSQRLLGIRFTVDGQTTVWLDADMQALQATLDKALPDTVNQLSVPQHGDSPWVLVQSFSDTQPGTIRVYDRRARRLVRVGEALPGLDPAALGRMQFQRIKARDGRDLPLYLTLPPGSVKKPPLVLLVHGGPWVRGAEWRFNPEVQFLASRGYAVLQPEFRGSAGYGLAHLQAGFRQWGRAMQDDLMDALRWAVDQGHVDAQRVCIAGSSYGGYAALMGLARDGDAFRCAVSWAGVTDPQLLFGDSWTDTTQEFQVWGLARMLGDPVADADKLKAVAPVRLAARINKPVLLAYGGWDTRVAIEHGERLRSALKPHNPAVEWVVYPEEGHGWSKAETRIDFWKRVEKFLAQNLAKPP